jgi:hypothetical protein
LELADIYHVVETYDSKELNRFLKHDWILLAVATHGDMDELGIKSESTKYSVGCNKKQYEFYKNHQKEFSDPDSFNLPF